MVKDTAIPNLCTHVICEDWYMLWFKFGFGAKILKLVQFLFSFVVYSLP